MKIGDEVVLKRCQLDRFVIQWIYENDYVEIRSVITGEIKPVHISEIEPLNL